MNLARNAFKTKSSKTDPHHIHLNMDLIFDFNNEDQPYVSLYTCAKSHM